MISIQDFYRIGAALKRKGYGEELEWSENVKPPTSAKDFAWEAIFVICNSGMKHTIATQIYDRVQTELGDGGVAFNVFKHPGKAAAIDRIFADRFKLYEAYMALETDELRLSFLESLPWIGGITKYHLAKNFGVDVAKPDVHLQRLADQEGVTAQQLCERLAAESGHRVATVDLVLWRACAIGLINSRTGEIRT